MNNHNVVIGIFENELYAIIAKRDLREAGIKANILKKGKGETLHLFNQADGVRLLVPETQETIAKKILQIKFV
jgi:predicted transcriptional regulator